jgi:hypothetical protein
MHDQTKGYYMKSIMEEASSIVKAIEAAWNRAGKPTEFSIKVLEYPESSLFGLKTVKSAKIAFYFNEQTVKQPQKEIQARPMRQPQAPRPTARPAEGEPSERPQERRHERGPQERRDRYQRGQDRRGRGEFQRRDRRDQRDGGYEQGEREPRDNWTPELVSAAEEWLKETLNLMGFTEIHINPSVSGGYLKLILDRPISEDARQEELQLKSWGNLIIESLREKANKPLRGLRVIIESRR